MSLLFKTPRHFLLSLPREDISDSARGMLANMWNYRMEGFLCDVILYAAKDNKKITAHGLVLSARNMFLKEVFNGRKEHIIFDTPGDVVESLVKYCYTGIIHVNKDNALLILPQASLLELDDVVKACSDVLISAINTENCLPIAKYARLNFNCQDLLERAEDFIKEHFEKVSLTNQFLQLSQNELEKYLSFDDLNVENEKQVFEAAMRWLNHDLKNRSGALSKLLPLIRMQHIDYKYLFDFVTNNSSNEYLSSLLDGIKHNLSNAQLKAMPARTWLKGKIVFVCTEKIQLYNHKSNVIEFTYDIPGGGGLFTPTLLGERLILVGRSEKVRCFDLNRKTWHEFQASMLTGRIWSSVEVLNEWVYAVGGLTIGGTNTVERWDSKLNSWSRVKEMNYARVGHCSAIVKGKLYSIGGLANGAFLNSVECYDPIADSWSACSPLLTARSHARAVTVNQEIFVFGGYNTNSRILNCIEKYNPETNTWTKVGQMSSKRERMGAYLFNNKIYLFGGQNENNEWLKTSMEEFDPLTNECKLIDAPNIEYTRNLYCFPYSSKNK